MVQQHPMKVGNLDSVLKNPASYPASSKVPTSISGVDSGPGESLPSRCRRRQCRAGMKKGGYS